MNHLGYVQDAARQHEAKQIGVPKHQSADPNQAGRQIERPILQLFPVGPPFETGFAPEADKPANHFARVAQIPAIGNERVRSQDNGFPGAFSMESDVPGGAPHDVTAAATEGKPRKEGVPDARRTEAAKAASQPLPPGMI